MKRVVCLLVLMMCMPHITMAEDGLYEEIVTKAKQYEIAPKDAVVDEVWKATPGYNGRVVDVEASYKKMKKKGMFDAKQLVFKEVSPRVHIGDLPPQPIYRGHPDKKMIALTINVAWGNEYIPSMLETLKKYHIKATFFFEGRWVKENEEIAKTIVAAKQEIGNHSYTHPDMKTLAAGEIERQLRLTNEAIGQITEQRVQWFAPPSGSYRDEVVTIASRLGMGTIMWTMDTIDWQKPEPRVLVNRVMKKAHNGGIILMHPTASTAKSLPIIIENLQKQGYQLGNVSQLLSEKRVD